MDNKLIILNLGLELVPKYFLGGIFDPIFLPILKVIEKITKRTEDVKDISSHKKSTKKASTSKKSSLTTSTTTTDTPETTTTTSVAQTSPTTTTTGGYMDWMSEYGPKQQDSLLETEPFSSLKAVWEDPTLSKIDTGIVSRYLKNNLQGLIDAYNAKLAENVGQKRT